VTNRPATRGRPADPDIEQRVLAAALTVYGEVGWAGFTLRMVIEAATGRGELPARIPPDFIIEAVMRRVISLIVLTPGARRATINAERARYAESITDYVLAAIAT
jgi:hypothetical protein